MWLNCNITLISVLDFFIKIKHWLQSVPDLILKIMISLGSKNKFNICVFLKIQDVVTL